MAGREEDIQYLRTELQASRWQMADQLQTLGEQLNVPQRLRMEVEAHPVKWAALALGLGLVAVAAVPLMARLTRGRGLVRLASPVLRLALVAALPLLKGATRAKTHTLTLK